MVVRRCAQCGRLATAIIPAAYEFVCVEHATEYWQALLRFAIRRGSRVATRGPAIEEHERAVRQAQTATPVALSGEVQMRVHYDAV
jgi:hypothetical protein